MAIDLTTRDLALLRDKMAVNDQTNFELHWNVTHTLIRLCMAQQAEIEIMKEKISDIEKGVDNENS